ncbi:hypothetical protein D3C81_1903770 [compost metagenome]
MAVLVEDAVQLRRVIPQPLPTHASKHRLPELIEGVGFTQLSIAPSPRELKGTIRIIPGNINAGPWRHAAGMCNHISADSKARNPVLIDVSLIP